jgi:hypothetical protein
VIKGGARKGAPVGVLGILFDWNESKPILNECLPTDQHGIIEGSAAFYVNKDHHIIATTNDQSFPIGKKIDPPKSCLELHSGQSSCGIITIDGNRFLIGSSKTKGYREYKGMEWIAHVIRPFD